MMGYTSTFDWITSQRFGSVHTRYNLQLDDIEKQLGEAFLKDFHP
jgi:hypothetical protein